MTQSECRTQRRLTKHSPIKLLQKMLVCGVVFGAMGNCVADQIPDTHFSPVLIAGTVLVDALESHDDREVFHLNSSERIWRDNSWGTQRTAYRVDFVGRCGSWTNDPLGAPQTPGITCQRLEPSIRLLDSIVANENLPGSPGSQSESFTEISAENINHDRLAGFEQNGFSVQHHVGPLILDEQVPRRHPLHEGYYDSAHRDYRRDSGQYYYPLVEPGRSFKIGHSLLELIIAAGLVIYSHIQLFDRFNRRRLAILILLYIAAFTLIFHAFSVLMFI